MKCLVILSGGLDSTTVLADCVHSGFTVEAISFNYGQRHSRELDMAKLSAKKYGIKHTILDLSCLGEISKTSALTGDVAVPEGHYESVTMKSTVVPNRNVIMAHIALSYAITNKIDFIELGVHAGDHAIYPDCRPVVIDTLNMWAAVADDDWKVTFVAPFLHMTKGDIVFHGDRIGADFSLTHTCYAGTEVPCGVCGACQERAEAFESNGITDPLVEKGGKQ